jgi:hypothetical protein
LESFGGRVEGEDDIMKKSYLKIVSESPHQRELRAERALLVITLNMSEEELTLILDEFGIDRSEYNLILSKHSRVVERLKEETKKEE